MRSGWEEGSSVEQRGNKASLGRTSYAVVPGKKEEMGSFLFQGMQKSGFYKSAPNGFNWSLLFHIMDGRSYNLSLEKRSN